MKSGKTERSENKDPRKHAATWVVKNEMGLTASEQDEFNDWLTENSGNREAYSSASRSWEDLDRLLGLQASYHAKVDPDLFEDNRGSIPFPKNKWLLVGLSLVASVALFISISTFLPNYLGSGENEVFDRSEIVFNRIERLDLEDGSTLILNHGTSVEPLYTKDERLVRLLEGEAIFEVEKDVNRPFIVEVSGIRVRAVGTAFNVRLSDHTVDVVVTEGVVALDAIESHEEPDPRLLEANQKAIISFAEDETSVSFEELDQSKVEAQTLWKPVLINFDDVPISQIVEEFNRRNPKQLVLVGSEFDRIRLTSYFWSDNIEGFLRLLERKYGIQIVEAEDEGFYLSRTFKSYKP